MTVPAVDTFTAHRFNVRVADLSDFQQRYEQAVPLYPVKEVDAMVEREASWTEMLDYIDSVAANGFLIYWRSDIHRVMRLADDKARCFAYLMGNHTIAERMYRHDPAIMLYAPLRTAIYEDADGTTWFSVDQPSTRFRSFGDPAIADVGLELDRKLAALLEHLGAPVPPTLTT